MSAIDLPLQILAVTNIIANADYDINSAQSPEQKQSAENISDFYKSILESLMELNNLKSA